MTPDSPQAAHVKEALDNLIHSASHSDLKILDALYHDSMTIYMMDANRELHLMDKTGFMAYLKQSISEGNTPSTWAKYHLVEADETNGHVVISRKANLMGDEKTITLSIDFVYEDGRWQITREVIFAL